MTSNRKMAIVKIVSPIPLVIVFVALLASNTKSEFLQVLAMVIAALIPCSTALPVLGIEDLRDEAYAASCKETTDHEDIDAIVTRARQRRENDAYRAKYLNDEDDRPHDDGAAAVIAAVIPSCICHHVF